MAEIAALNHLGIVATGDELVNGDILNTNSQYVAQQCIDHNIVPGTQIVVADDRTQIESSIQFLLNQHRAVMTIGGLGPTSDDITRFALASVLDQPLIFDEECWQAIIKRLTQYNLTIPESNRQQCLFPANAEIIPNPNGTAAGCFINHNDHLIFMLPGPPHEFKPLFDEFVLPKLINHGFQQSGFRHSWLLIGASEGSIAEHLEKLAEGFNCQLGYRASSPYIEIKLMTKELDTLQKLQSRFKSLLDPFLVSEKKQIASLQLLHFLENSPDYFVIDDKATHGLLETTLVTRTTFSKISFQGNFLNKAAVSIEVRGLDSYWKNKATEQTLQIKISRDGEGKEIHKTIPWRNQFTLVFALEIICLEMLRYLCADKR